MSRVIGIRRALAAIAEEHHGKRWCQSALPTALGVPCPQQASNPALFSTIMMHPISREMSFRVVARWLTGRAEKSGAPKEPDPRRRNDEGVLRRWRDSRAACWLDG